MAPAATFLINAKTARESFGLHYINTKNKIFVMFTHTNYNNIYHIVLQRELLRSMLPWLPLKYLKSLSLEY